MIEFKIWSSEANYGESDFDEYFKGKQEIRWEIRVGTHSYSDFVVVENDWASAKRMMPMLFDSMCRTVADVELFWKEDKNVRWENRYEQIH